jgi:hypothetical protein
LVGLSENVPAREIGCLDDSSIPSNAGVVIGYCRTASGNEPASGSSTEGIGCLDDSLVSSNGRIVIESYSTACLSKDELAGRERLFQRLHDTSVPSDEGVVIGSCRTPLFGKDDLIGRHRIGSGSNENKSHQKGCKRQDCFVQKTLSHLKTSK